jgi:Hypothetical protein (DUF2513)
MKRDMDIIRRILLDVEDDRYHYGALVHLDDVPDEICAQHVALIFDAGLAEGRLIKTDAHGIVGACVDRLTSSGHDFCDGIRQDTIWNKAKEHVIKPGASYGLSVLIEYVKFQVHQIVFGGPPHA